MYRSVNPEWYYDYVKIDNLEKIVQELRQVYFSQSDRMRCSTPYWNIYSDQFLECTAFHDFLKSFNLLQKFEKIIFNDLEWAHLPDWEKGKILPHALHIDSFDTHVKFSLNIPIDHCETSYYMLV